MLFVNFLSFDSPFPIKFSSLFQFNLLLWKNIHSVKMCVPLKKIMGLDGHDQSFILNLNIPKKSFWNLQNHLFWNVLYTTIQRLSIYVVSSSKFNSLHLILNSCMSVVIAPHSPVRHQSELWNRSSKCAKYLLSSADSEDEHSNCGTSSLADSAAAASVADAN